MCDLREDKAVDHLENSSVTAQPGMHWLINVPQTVRNFVATLASHRVGSCELSFMTYYLIQLIDSLFRSILICRNDIYYSWKDFHILSVFTQNATTIFLTGAPHQFFPTLPVFCCNKDFSHLFWLFQNLHTPIHPLKLRCKHILM